MSTDPSFPLDPRDRILQAHTPAVMVPTYGKLPPLEKSGHRYLVASNGLWLEVRRPWLHAVQPLWNECIAYEELKHAPPCGPIQERIQYAFHAIEVERMGSLFEEQARAALPDEAAAWAVWNEVKRELVYMPLKPTETSPARITYHRPTLAPHLHLAIDFHSHGTGFPRFSSTDDEDDCGEVKLAMVAGCVDEPDAEWFTRLCLLGLYINLGSL